ncbi:hypothetical protein H9L39_17908, partial [Fusarium oxysporum f. sp. albedinis]
TQKSVLPAESHGTPQSHNSSSKATIPQPLPQTRLAAIGKATGTSSMANARAKSYRNALPPSISSVETDIEPSLPAGPESTPLQHNEFSGSQSQCLKDDFESYVNRFHHRWHIITAPAYDFSEKPFDNAASVIMIGSYLSGKHGHNHLHINIHDKLQEQVLARANSLCGWFIETLKVTGFLNRSHAQQVLQTEFPGSYGPWVSMLTDEWKRFVDLISAPSTFSSFLS